MANTNVSHAEAKSIVDKLECSPSQHDATGNYGGAPSISPTAKNNLATGGKHHLATPEMEFQMRDRTQGLPNYKTKFARGARQE